MLLTLKQAAEKIGAPVRTVQRYAQQLGIPQHAGSFMVEVPSIAFDQLRAMAQGRSVKTK